MLKIISKNITHINFRKSAFMKNKNIFLTTLSLIYILVLSILIIYFLDQNKKAFSYTYPATSYSLNSGKIADDGTSLYIDESYGFSGVFADAFDAHLRSGNYTITVNYEASADNSLHLCPNSNYDVYLPMPASETVLTHSFSVWPASISSLITIDYNGSGTLLIKSLTITSDQPIYTDYIYFIILTIILGISIPAVLIYLIKKKRLDKQQWFVLGFFTILDLIINFPLTYGYVWRGTDMLPHLARADGVNVCISLHRIPTIMIPTTNRGYGTLSCMYPDKLLYLPAFLRNRGVSELVSYGTMHFIVNTAAIIIMYYCVHLLTKSRFSAIVSTILFTLATNRLYIVNSGSQTYSQGVSILFVPLVIVGLYEVLFGNGKKWWLLSIGITGALCSHMISTVLIVILCAVTFFFCEIVYIKHGITKEGQRLIFKNIGIAAITTIGLSLSTIAPFLYYSPRLSTEAYSGGKSFMMSLDDLLSHTKADSTIAMIQNILSHENAIFHALLLILLIAIIVVYKKKSISFLNNLYSIYCTYLIICGFGLFWLTTNLFPWKILDGTKLMSNFDKFQFAERFMILGVPMLCIGFGMLLKPLSVLIEDVSDDNRISFKKLNIIFSIFFIAFLSLGIYKIGHGISTCDILVPDRVAGNLDCFEDYFIPTGVKPWDESNQPICNDWESVNNISYIRKFDQIHYEYTCSSDGIYIEFPEYYFKGYRAYDIDGNEVQLIDGDRHHVRLNLQKTDEPIIIDIGYKSPFFVYVCSAISLIVTILLYAYILFCQGRLKCSDS